MGKDKFNGYEKRDIYVGTFFLLRRDRATPEHQVYLSVPEIRLQSNMFERGGGGRFYKESQSLS